MPVLERITGGVNLAKRKIDDITKELAGPILGKKGFDLVEVEYTKEGPNWYLRVYIDKQGGITVDDCQRVSEELSDELDRMDPIDHSYILEVSSPGINRPLKTQRDYEYFRGRMIDIKLYSPIKGEKEFSGKLVGLADGFVTVQLPEGKISVPKDSIASARLAFKF